MATHKSAIKRYRQSEKRNERNRSAKSEITTLTKKVLAATQEEAQKLLTFLQSKLDRAGRKGLVHRKTASRKVGRLTKAVAKAK